MSADKILNGLFLRRHNGTHFGAGFRPVFTENLNGILTIARGTWRWRFSARKTMLIDSASSSRIAQALALASVRGGQSGLSAFLYDWLFRGCERTFRPLHRGVVTTYALENGAAGDGDNRDHSLFAIRAARCSIHEILPIYTHNQELELLFHLSVTAKTGGCHGSRPGHARSARAAAGPSTLRYRQHASDVPIERSCRNWLTGAGWEGELHELARARLVEIRPGIGRRYTWTLQLPASDPACIRGGDPCGGKQTNCAASCPWPTSSASSVNGILCRSSSRGGSNSLSAIIRR